MLTGCHYYLYPSYILTHFDLHFNCNSTLHIIENDVFYFTAVFEDLISNYQITETDNMMDN